MSMDDAKALIAALKTDHDATYADGPTADVKAHQQAHDKTNMALQALPGAVEDTVAGAVAGLASEGYVDSATSEAKERDGATFGVTSDTSGALGIDVQDDGWGIDADGTVYWDPDGPTPDDEAMFSFDPDGAPYWRRIRDVGVVPPPDAPVDLSYLRRSAGNGDRVALPDSFASVKAHLEQLGNTPGTITIPPGQYVLEDPDDLKFTLNDKRLVGFGPETTVFRFADGVNPSGAAVLHAVECERLSLAHIGFDGNRDGNPTGGMWGARFLNCEDVTLEHVSVRDTRRTGGVGGSGVLIDGGVGFDLARVVADNCDYHGISLTTSPHDVTMTRCIGRNCTIEGIHTSTGAALITGCWAYGNGYHGFGAQNAFWSTYTGCVALDNGRDGFNASSGAKTFTGCYARGNGWNGFAFAATGGGIGSLTVTGCISTHNTLRGFYATQLAGGVAFTGLVARNNSPDHAQFEIETLPTSGIPSFSVSGGSLIGAGGSLKVSDYTPDQFAIRGVHTPQGVEVGGQPFHEASNIPYSGSVSGATTVAEALDSLA